MNKRPIAIALNASETQRKWPCKTFLHIEKPSKEVGNSAASVSPKKIENNSEPGT
jgi:hypothetical protein